MKQHQNVVPVTCFSMTSYQLNLANIPNTVYEILIVVLLWVIECCQHCEHRVVLYRFDVTIRL